MEETCNELIIFKGSSWPLYIQPLQASLLLTPALEADLAPSLGDTALRGLHLIHFGKPAQRQAQCSELLVT